MSLIKFVSQFSPNAQLPRCNQMLLSLPALGLSHEHQQVRMKSVIKFCGYLEHAEFKKRDIRYKASTRHDTKRMSWSDFQFRKWKAVHWNKSYPMWQSQMDYAENLCRLGMPTWTIHELTKLHPHCIDYLQRKVSGNVTLLREAEFSNYVNHRTGER